MGSSIRAWGGFAALAVSLAAASCHRKPPEPVPAAEEENEAAPAAPLPPSPPPAPAAPTPAPPPSPPKPPPPPPVSADQQMLDDAAATGMTAPIERRNDEAGSPADATGNDSSAGAGGG